jgi:hypothetical protein
MMGGLLQKRGNVDEAKVRFDRKRDNYRRLKNTLLIRHLSNVAAGNPIERKEVFAGKKKSRSKEKLIGL